MASTTLLLVDDDEALRHVLAAVLAEHGCDVITAGSGSCHSAADRSDSGKADEYSRPDRSDRAEVCKWTSSLSHDRERGYDSRIIDRRIVGACQGGQKAGGSFYESRAAPRSYLHNSAAMPVEESRMSQVSIFENF
jgi:hypothetical protein